LEQLMQMRGTNVDADRDYAKKVNGLIEQVVGREMSAGHPTRALIENALKNQQTATAVVLTHISPTMLWS